MLSEGDEVCTPVAGARDARGLPWIGTTEEAIGMDMSNTSMGTAAATGCGGTSGGGRAGRECSRSSRGGAEEGCVLGSAASWPRHSAAAAVRAASAASSILVEGPWRHLEGAARELKRLSWRGGGIWPG